MKQPFYHGIIIDCSFKDKNFVNNFNIFNKKISGNWNIFGIVVKKDELENVIKDIQANLVNKGYYVHLYNDEDVIVVFKEKVFNVTTDVYT